jgi:hypothetical protein
MAAAHGVGRECQPFSPMLRKHANWLLTLVFRAVARAELRRLDNRLPLERDNACVTVRKAQEIGPERQARPISLAPE